jgi:hypothetical protein
MFWVIVISAQSCVIQGLTEMKPLQKFMSTYREIFQAYYSACRQTLIMETVFSVALYNVLVICYSTLFNQQH